MAARATCFCRESTGINFSYHRRIGGFRYRRNPTYRGPCTKPQAQTARFVVPPLLSLFFQEIISGRQLVRRGNPRFPMARQSEKQRKPSLFSLFPAVHVDKRID